MSGRALTPGAQGTGGQITEAVSPGLGRWAPLPAASRLAEGRRRPTALGSQDVFHGRCQICHQRVRNAPFPLILPHVWSKSRVRRPGLPSRTGSNPAGMTGGGFRPWRLLRASPLCNSVFETLLCPPPHLPLRSLAGLSPLQPSVRGDVPRGRAAVP